MRQLHFLALSFLLFIPTISLAQDQDAQVSVEGQNRGEISIKVSYFTTGFPEVQGVREGDREWILIQPSEKKVIETQWRGSSEGEGYFLDKIFYFDKCSFGQDKFEYWVKFRRGGRLEGFPRAKSNYDTPPRESSSFKPLDGRWRLERTFERNKIIIDFDSLLGMTTRYVLRIEIRLDEATEGIFPSVAESSKPINYPPYFSATDTEKQSCFMKEWH
jgi:hypothetical protein